MTILGPKPAQMPVKPTCFETLTIFETVDPLPPSPLLILLSTSSIEFGNLQSHGRSVCVSREP